MKNSLATKLIALTLTALVMPLAFVPNPASAQASAATKTLFAGQLIDVRTGRLRSNMRIRVANGLISAVEQADSLEPGDIDLSNFTVLPGLIDTHTHLCDNSYMGDAFDHWTYPAATFGIVGVVNAGKTLRAGFTTVRDVSAPFYANVALRDAINAGWVQGPRVFASGAMITMTGGHGSWGNWIGPQHQVTTDAHVQADGVDGVRKAVRVHRRSGVDLIKVAATGGFGTANSKPGAASYSLEELRAAVEEAEKHGMSVAAHAHGNEGVLSAVRAGVTSIEHASMADSTGLEAMKAAGTWLVMDLLAARFDLVERVADFSDKGLAGPNQEIFEAYLALFGRAYKSGIRMAFGTDAGIYPHGRNAEQFALMVRAGMSHEDALRSATIWAAELLGQAGELGEVQPGLRADLIAVAGNPLEDISELESVAFVMKDGAVVVAP